MKFTPLLVLALFISACEKPAPPSTPSTPTTTKPVPQEPFLSWAKQVQPLEGEKHFAWIRQLTTNVGMTTHAEAYWAPDGKKIIFQAVREGDKSDQIYTIDLATGKIVRLSDGKGKCTCSDYFRDGRYIYSTTALRNPAPPPPIDRKLYSWIFLRDFDVVLVDPKTGTVKPLTTQDGYDAEATISHDEKKIIFTSHRDKHIGLYMMNPDGSDVRRVNKRDGYAGGAWFSPDDQWLVYRAFYPSNDREKGLWERILKETALFAPPNDVAMEIYVSRVDGSEERAVTKLGVSSFAPYFLPDQKRIIFSSNYQARVPGDFALWIVNADGTGTPERVTKTVRTDKRPPFDSFPCFSPDGKHLVWCSNRDGTAMNIFVAEWKE